MDTTFESELYQSFGKDASDYVGKTSSEFTEFVPVTPYITTPRSSARSSGSSLFVFCPSECADLGDDTCRTEKSYQENDEGFSDIEKNKSAFEDLDFIPITQYSTPPRRLSKTPRSFLNVSPLESLTNIIFEREKSLFPISEEEADDVVKSFLGENVEKVDGGSDRVEKPNTEGDGAEKLKAESDDVEKPNTESDGVEKANMESDDFDEDNKGSDNVEEDIDNDLFVTATHFSTTSGTSNIFCPSGNQDIANLTFDTEDSFQTIYEEVSDYIDQNESDGDEFVPATQYSTTSDPRPTSGISSELDDTITQMERLLALADEAEIEENLHLANINVIPFPPNLPSSHVEDELAKDGLDDLDRSYEAMEISANGLAGLNNVVKHTYDFVEKDRIISPRRSRRMSIGSVITKIHNRVKLLSAPSTPKGSGQVELTPSSSLTSHLTFVEDTMSDVNIGYFPPDLPCSYAETALAIEGELIQLQCLEQLEEKRNELDEALSKDIRSGSRVHDEEMILSPPWAKQIDINLGIQKNKNTIGSASSTPTEGPVHHESLILPKKKQLFKPLITTKPPTTKASSKSTKASSTPTKAFSTSTKATAMPTKTVPKPAETPQHCRLTEMQGKLKSPIQLINKCPRQFGPSSSLTSTSTNFSSTPFRKGVPLPLIMSSPASTIGFPTPSPYLDKGKPATSSMPNSVRKKSSIPTPSSLRMLRLPNDQSLIKTPAPVVKSSVVNVNSPVASYVYSTPSVQKIKRAGSGTPERIYQTLLPNKIVRLEGSGIPIRSNSFNSSLKHELQDLPKQCVPKGLAEVETQSAPTPPTSLAIVNNTSEGKTPSMKRTPSSTSVPTSVLVPVTMNVIVDTDSPALINFESPTLLKSKEFKHSATKIEQSRMPNCPQYLKEADGSTMMLENVDLISDNRTMDKWVEEMEEDFDEEEEVERGFHEVYYVGSELNRNDSRIVIQELIPPCVAVEDIPIMLAFPAGRETKNIFSQRHIGEHNSSGTTSIVKQEHVIKKFIPGHVGTLNK